MVRHRITIRRAAVVNAAGLEPFWMSYCTCPNGQETRLLPMHATASLFGSDGWIAQLLREAALKRHCPYCKQAAAPINAADDAGTILARNIEGYFSFEQYLSTAPRPAVDAGEYDWRRFRKCSICGALIQRPETIEQGQGGIRGSFV